VTITSLWLKPLVLRLIQTSRKAHLEHCTSLDAKEKPKKKQERREERSKRNYSCR
jgi:hypothetical protein